MSPPGYQHIECHSTKVLAVLNIWCFKWSDTCIAPRKCTQCHSPLSTDKEGLPYSMLSRDSPGTAIESCVLITCTLIHKHKLLTCVILATYSACFSALHSMAIQVSFKAGMSHCIALKHSHAPSSLYTHISSEPSI